MDADDLTSFLSKSPKLFAQALPILLNEMSSRTDGTQNKIATALLAALSPQVIADLLTTEQGKQVASKLYNINPLTVWLKCKDILKNDKSGLFLRHAPNVKLDEVIKTDFAQVKTDRNVFINYNIDATRDRHVLTRANKFIEDKTKHNAKGMNDEIFKFQGEAWALVKALHKENKTFFEPVLETLNTVSQDRSQKLHPTLYG